MNFKQFRQKALENPEVHQEYDALQEEFSLIDQLIAMRTKAGLTQEDVAKKLGTNKSNISRHFLLAYLFYRLNRRGVRVLKKRKSPLPVFWASWIGD